MGQLSDNFEVDDLEFSLEALLNEERLKLLPHIIAMLAPLTAMSEGQDMGSLMKGAFAAAEAAERVPFLTKAFEKRCKWRKSGEDGWKSAGWDGCFRRAGMKQIKWLVECCKLEFADFLPELEQHGLTLEKVNG